MGKNLIFEKYQKDFITYDEFLSFCKDNLPKLEDNEEVFVENKEITSENINKNNNKYNILWYN